MVPVSLVPVTFTGLDDDAPVQALLLLEHGVEAGPVSPVLADGKFIGKGGALA